MNDNKKRPGSLCLGAIICLVLFVVLTLVVRAGLTQQLDERVALAFYGLRSKGLTGCLKVVTFLGNWQSITILCVLLVAIPATRRTWGLPVTAAALISNAIRAIVKSLIARPRPDEVHHLIVEDGWSFPSGHALTSLAVYGLLAYFLLTSEKRWQRALGIICAILAFAIGLTRIYLGVHYPCDVLGGWLAGAGCLMAVLLFVNNGIFQPKRV